MALKRRVQSEYLILPITFVITIGLISLKVDGRSGQNESLLNIQNPATTKTKQPTTTPSPKPEQDEAIRINSNLVVVPVSVTDVNGQPAMNLKPADFRLEEDGRTQEIVSLGNPVKTPVELALLFDVSSSVSKRFDFEREAASRFLKQVLKPIDTASVFTIGTKPKLVTAKELSVEKLITKVMTIAPAREATAFFDTVAEAAQHLTKTSASGSRRVLIVISDGEDTVSDHYNLAGTQRVLQQAECLFYAINPSGESIRLNILSSRGHNGMQSLAEVTGGRAFLPKKLEDLDEVFRQVSAELQAQYLLLYYSSDDGADGNYRRITVRVPQRPDLRIRARQGYYSQKI